MDDLAYPSVFLPNQASVTSSKGADYATYRAELHTDVTPRSMRVGCLLVIGINSAFLVLDRWVYPERFEQFLVARLVLNAVIVVIYMLARKWPSPLQIFGCFATGILTLAVIYGTGGATSYYYAGLIILFVGIPALLTLTGRQATLLIATLILGFILPELAINGISNSRILAVNSFILVAAGGNSAFCSWLIDRSRFFEFLQRRQIQRASRQVETFARAVSHDIRTPVVAASEALRIAQASGTTPNSDLLDLASSNLLHADRMISGLRDLMRAVGSQSPRFMIDPRHVFDGVATELAESTDLRASQVVASGQWIRVSAPAEELAHVFRNLLANALAHNQEQPDLRVEVSQEIVGDEVRFRLSDNGQGVTPALANRIFEPFYRAPEGRDGGLGLGLAIVQGFVSQWGGRVWVDPSERGGATFVFTIPRDPSPAH